MRVEQVDQKRQCRELNNRLRLVSVERPHTPTIVLKALIQAGSRYDRKASGGAHLLEHLLFKGTRSRSAREIYADIENLGGVIEGHTGKEYVCFQVTLPSHHFKVGAEVLADVLGSPLLTEKDFWNEKLIVAHEIQRKRDSVNFIYDLFAEAMWPNHPLGRPIWGDVKKLADLEHSELIKFYQQTFVTDNAVLVLCGNLEHNLVVDVIEQQFASFSVGKQMHPPIVKEEPLLEPRLVHVEKDLFQTHLLLGFPTIGMKHSDRYALQVVERVLGMGGSSRLFRLLREETKLAYATFPVMASYQNAGYLAIHTTCRPENVLQVKDLLLQEFDRLGREGITIEELARAKSNYEGTLARRLETNLAIASIYGVKTLLHQIEPFAETVARIKAVTDKDVIRVAKKYFIPSRHILAIVGQIK